MKQLRLLLMLLLCAITSGVWAATATLKLGSNNQSSLSGTIDSKINWTLAQGSGTNAPAHTNATYSKVYAGNTITISVVNTSTTKVTSIKLSAQSNYIQTWTASDASTVTVSGNDATWNGQATSVTLTNSATAQARLNTITITYTEATGPSIIASDVELDAEATSGEISYSIENPSDANLTAAEKSPGYDWIDNVTVDEGNAKVTFTTTANTGTEREGYITLTYGAATKDVKITQAAFIPSHNLTFAVSPVDAGNVTLGATSVKEGATTTATATNNSGYEFAGWTISGTGASLSSNTDNPTTITMGTDDAVVTANFSVVVTHEIKWSVNGVVVKTENIKEGEALNFDAPESGIPTGYTFTGWVTEANTIDVPTDVDPSANYVASATCTTDITYYAVFAIQEGETYWKKVAASAVSEAGVYAIIGPGNKPFTGSITSGHGAEAATAFVFDASGKASSAPEGTCELTLAVSESGFTMYHEGDAYGYLYATKAGSGGLAWHSTESSYWYYNSDKSNWVYNTNTARLRYAAVQSNPFRTYGADNGDVISFAMKVDNASYSNYCTTLPTATITLSSACTDGDFFYGTYSNESAFVVPGDIIVSEIYVEDGEMLLEDYAEGAVVPANTGVVITSDVAGDHQVMLAAGGTSVLGTDNMLRPSGVTAAVMGAADADCKFYRLTMHNNTELGFWWGAENGAAFDYAATNKAYLAVPASQTAKLNGFTFRHDDTTALSQMETMRNVENEKAPMYNLAGQRVSKAYKGLVIVNGKKIVRK